MSEMSVATATDICHFTQLDFLVVVFTDVVDDVI